MYVMRIKRKKNTFDALDYRERKLQGISRGGEKRKCGGYRNGADHYRATPALHRGIPGYKMIPR